MPFPTTGLIDNFNRANSANLGTNWTFNPWNYGSRASCEIDNNGAQKGVGAGLDGTNYWNVSQFGPDCEVYTTIAASTAADYVSLEARIINPVSVNADGYRCELVRPNTLKINRIDNGNAGTQLGATMTQAIGVGDSLGFGLIGPNLTAYYKTAGVWAAISTRVDATYPAAGYIGIYLSGPGGLHVDDYSGGTAIPVPSAFRRTMRGAGL